MSHLAPEQKRVWDVMRPHNAEPSRGQTPEQASNFAVLSFLHWCAFDGLRPATDPRGGGRGVRGRGCT